MINFVQTKLQISSKRFGLAVLAAVLPCVGAAQEAGDCDWRASSQVIAEPWEANTRTFAEGEIRLTIMDVGEPAAGSFFLMILSPPYGDAGRQCAMLALDADGMGFASLSMEGAKADYDPATGLSVTLATTRWLPETDSYTDATLSVTINQDTGAISGTLD
jgi:hypothetical protein